MFRIDWNLVATDAFLTELRDIAGAQGPDDNTLRPLVAMIFHHAGGMPVTEQDWSESHCNQVARRLMHEATGRVLRRHFGRRRNLPGLEQVETDTAAPFDEVLRSVSRIAINSATADELEPLPVLGSALAEQVVTVRRLGGAFQTPLELADRVKGLGEKGVTKLESRLSFAQPGQTGFAPDHVFVGTFAEDFATLLATQPQAGADERLRVALELLVADCADHPHPCNIARQARDDLTPGSLGDRPSADTVVDHVGVLADASYQPAVVKLISQAASKIDVAMFFAALSNQAHPTHKLLDALVERSQAGVAVRVLLDRDREDDPYGSRLINSAAARFLSDAGVPVRQDEPENLLHSKFLAIDGQVAVIGSHNWTKGSFQAYPEESDIAENYDDVSLAVEGGALADQLHSRFEQLWARGEDFS